MKAFRLLLFLILATALVGCAPKETLATPPEATSTSAPEVTRETPTALLGTEESLSSPTLTPTPNPFTQFYGCNMELVFTSGPLASKGTQFAVLERDYFVDKGDKFNPGKGTSIYYEDPHYFILHSSFVNGNALRPMEAEFLRKYLEYWGTSGEAYIQGQIDNLIGSTVSWVCDGELVFETEISGIERLSHIASNRLWLKAEELEEILIDREGLVSEWVGEIELTDDPHLYVGFCGWGPESAGDARFTYFRYLIQFGIR